jgi:MFS family permease
VLLVLFTVRSARHPAPVVELRLLRPPAFALAALSALLFFAAFAVLLLANVLFLTEVWHYSVLKAGFAFFPGPIAAAVVAGLSGRHGGRTASPVIGAAGGVIFALASIWFLTRLGGQQDYLGSYLPGALVGGIGVGLVLPALTALATGTLPPARLATGIGIQTTFRQIGAAVGLAAFVAIVGDGALTTTDDFEGAWIFMALAAVSAGAVLVPLVPLARAAASPVR